MTPPSSEQLESFFERLRSLDRELAKIKTVEVSKAETLGAIRTVSRDWLRLSEALRAAGAISPENLKTVDAPLAEMLESTNQRTRPSTYRTKLRPVLSSFNNNIVVPIIRHEGSPAQVASRQLMAEFAGKVSTDEQAYIEEAARCLASGCNRAAIIMLWAAGISRFHSAIEKIGFNAYNLAVDQTTQKRANPFSNVSKSHVSSLPELQRARDYDLIVVGMQLWNYDLQVYGELERLLGTRNNAAHPGMLRPNALDVQQYASKVGAYVFSVVPV